MIRISPFHQVDEFPMLDRFQLSPAATRALEDAWFVVAEFDDAKDLKNELREVRLRLADLEIDISEARAEERKLEEREAEIEIDLANLTDDAVIGMPRNFACTECPWNTFDASEASEWRTEEHAHLTGHKVALVLTGGSQFFEQDRIDLEVYL